jgi:hypothetical protein
LNNKGKPIDPGVKIAWRLEYTDDGVNYTTYQNDIKEVKNGVRSFIEIGAIAKHSSKSRVVLVATQDNSPSTRNASVVFETSNLALTLPATFSNLTYFDYDQVKIPVTAKGDMNKIVELYYDDMDVPY